MPDLTFVDRTVELLGPRPEAVIPILQAIQEHYRYLPEDALRRVCEKTEITPAAIAGVATFYTQFRHRPVGRHIISVCHGTACHVKGSGLVQDALERRLGIADGEDTDAERLFTIEKVACLGCCTLAPVVQIDDVTYGHVTPPGVAEVLADFLRQQKDGKPIREHRQKPPSGPVGEIRVGLGSCCQAGGSGKVHQAIRQTLSESGAAAVVKRVGCVGMCHQTPLVELISPDGQARLFSKVGPEEAPSIVLSQFKPKGIARRVGYTVSRWLDRLSTDEPGNPVARHAIDVRDEPVCAFLGRQQHLATESCGQIDPTDLDEYIRHGGFETLRQCLTERTPEQLIEEAKASGLRGRGGAGFPTGLKWEIVRAAEGDKKYIICNGDEGDPGAFMDRMLLESFPYRIIEGMAIAARAVGTDEGVFYIRAEYPLAVRRVAEAIDVCNDRGLLGDRVMDTDFSLHLSIMEGAGAFVCGEETALLASIEGRRGMPRLRPPFPAASGLWERPTLINNVETYALVPWIFRHGAEAFAALGTEGSKGTKVFALAGKIRRGGLIEVPMGMTVGEIVDEIGGGVADGRQFKAVQVGGPSGGCVPAELADTRVDYQALAEVGAIMGSGGLVVLDDTDCMVDIARYFLRFTQDQSCGKCTFCRIGTRRMLDILDRICEGDGKPGDLELLEQLARQTKAGSICGLGGTAPNPVLSTLRYFRDEYEAHLQGRCPAGKCKALIAYRVTDDCIGCTLCAQHCPVDAIPMAPYQKHVIDLEKCTRCDTCRQVCPQDAVVVE
ncbi:MAG: NAD(P)H-dependent oxidoreductase subunit E [Candidatus Nealsonbacteria bacterium]|nr:NAD(P)H-dependent oxidoreductase subunit E [Candidatus Nealsonbacteria bacterium]